jgi:hypothetical protein
MLSLITTCKNRLPHLKQTLPLMLQQPRAEVVDDYGYDQGTASWVREQHPAKSTMIRSLALREREIWVQEMPPMRRFVFMEGQNSFEISINVPMHSKHNIYLKGQRGLSYKIPVNPSVR